MNNIVNKRLDFIDLAKGFGMLMVIYLHITINYPSEINIYAGSRWDSFVHSMFMPIFFILSGYFFSVKRPFKEWIHKKMKRLLVPFVIFYLFTYLMNVVLVTFLGVHLKSGFSYSDIFVVFYKDVYPNSAIWFLLSLFWTSLILYGIMKITDKLILQTILVFVSFSMGVLLDKTNTNIPLYVDTSFTATIFLFTGYLFKRFWVVECLQATSKTVQNTWMVGVFIVGFLTCYVGGQGISMVNNVTGQPICFYFTAVAGSLSVIALSYMIVKLPVISYVGRYSMLVLCTHMYLTNALSRILMKFDFSFLVSSLLALIMVCICYYAVVPVVRKIKILECLL